MRYELNKSSYIKKKKISLGRKGQVSVKTKEIFRIITLSLPVWFSKLFFLDSPSHPQAPERQTEAKSEHKRKE